MSQPSPAAAVDAPTRPTGASPVTLAVISAVLLFLAFPTTNWHWLAWVALVPLFLLVRSPRRARSVYLGCWAGGFVFWALAVSWVRLTDDTAWLAWLAMALALSFFWPLFLVLTRVAVLRLRLPLMLAAPLVWVALEYARAYAVTGFPWYYLAHSQHSVLPLIQVADFAGSLGVSLLIVVVNAWLVDLLTLPLLRATERGPRLTAAQSARLAWVVALAGGTLAYGAFRLSTASFRDGPRVALLQSNLIQRYKQGLEPHDVLNIYRALVAKAAQGSPRPDLIVWPETSFPFAFAAIDPKVAGAELERQVKSIGPSFTVERWRTRLDDVTRLLRELPDALGIPMLYGVATYDHSPTGLSKYNSAVLMGPHGLPPQSYHKLHLVPFGEYVPLIETLPWLTALTPYHGPDAYVPSLTFGRGPVWLDLGPYRVATAICFEDTVPQVVRRFFAEVKDGRRPDILINQSNDGWFTAPAREGTPPAGLVNPANEGWYQGSAEHDMHLAISVFRAVENRVPLARAANTGISAIVNSNGRVLAALPKLTEGVLVGVLPLDDRQAPYSRWGDWLGLVCLAVTIGLVPLAWLRPTLLRRPAN